MEGPHYFLKSLGLESYMAHDSLPRVDMDNLVYNPISDAKLKEEQVKGSDSIKDICDRQVGINDEVSQITAGIQADDFFSSLELQSSSKISSNMLGLSFSNKLTGGIVTRSRFSSSTVQDASKPPGEKMASKSKTKGRPKKDRKRRRSEKSGSGRRVKTKGKNRKLQSGKKLSADGKDKVSMLADSKKQNSNKLEETALEKSLALEKCKDDDDWVLFNNLGLKKEIDDKMFENKQIPNDLQNPVRRCTPELFSMNSILMSDGMSEGKDDVDNLLEAEDYDDSFLEDMEEFNYAPPRSYTGGKWKPGSFRTSPMLWHNQNWDSILDDRHQDEDRRARTDTLADSPTEAFGEKLNKFSTTLSTGSKWKSFVPPATHTGGKWKPIAPLTTHTTGKWKPITPPASYTGGKWKPSEFPQRFKKSDQELMSPDDGDNGWKYETEREADPPPTHTGGKWKPSTSHSTELWKPETASPDLEVVPPTRGKWGSSSDKSSVNRSTLDVLANSQSTSGKCLKTSGGMIQYYCSPCSRRLSSKKMYRKHVQSELHLKRVLQENELEFDSRSLKLFRGLFTQAGCRKRGLGKRIIKRPEIFGNLDSMKTVKKDKKGSLLVKLKRKRLARREMLHCEVCKVKVPSHQMGKHLVSYCHSRRIQLSDPDQQKLILDNIHAIVKQAPYQCGICKFYCNTHALFKKHWALAVHEEVEESKNQRFWCALCSFETETSRSMELHLDSNSHREVILAVNKSIPIIIRHKVIFNCGICFKEFRFNRELIRHKEIFHEKADSDKRNKFACPICQHNCKSIKSLQMHTLTTHKGNTKVPYFCSTCNEFFDTAVEAKVHRNSQVHKYKKLGGDGENPDKASLSRNCTYCGETLESITKLKTHLLERHTEFLPKCIKCGMLFALSQEVSRHVKNNECDFSRKSSQPSSSDSFACESCSFTTNLESEFLLHKAVHEKKDKDEKKISCPLCNSLFTQAALSIHLRTHLKERTYECAACSKAFVRKDRYLSHLKQGHGSDKESLHLLEASLKMKKEENKEEKLEESHKSKVEEAVESITEDLRREKKNEEKTSERRQICGDGKCKYIAKDLNDLENHSLFHIGPNLYQCPECPFSAKTNTEIKRHYLIHIDERSFPCHLCSFKARLKSHLKRHLRLHTGAKPYKCPHCSYTCNNLENLRKHVIYTMVHPGKKMYECKFCGFSTNSSKDFKAHLFKCHKDDYRSAEASELVGIYNREIDCETTSTPIPVKPRAPKIQQQKKGWPEAVKKKAELLNQRYNPIAPKPSFINRKMLVPSLSSKTTGNLVEDKRKILKMELEKLKNQIKSPVKKLPKSYPSPAEKEIKMKTSVSEGDKIPPKKAAEEENTQTSDTENGGVFLLNMMPAVVSVAEELPSKVTVSTSNCSASPQMEFSSACILYENVLPSEEMELYLLEDYQV